MDGVDGVSAFAPVSRLTSIEPGITVQVQHHIADGAQKKSDLDQPLSGASGGRPHAHQLNEREGRDGLDARHERALSAHTSTGRQRE